MKSFTIQGRSSVRINRQAVEQRKGARDRLVILLKIEGEHMHQTLRVKEIGKRETPKM